MSDLITEGLEARQRASSQPKPTPISAKGAPINVAALKTVARKVQLARIQHRNLSNAANNHMAKWREQREAALAAVPAKQRAELIAAEEPGERAKALSMYKDERAKHLDTIAASAASVRATTRIFRDSVAYLDVQTLGNGKRSVYDRQLEGAGPARIADALLLAEVNGDAELYAAAHGKLGRLSKAEKESVASRVDARRIADSLVAADLREAAGCLAAIEYHAADVARESDMLIGKTPSSDTKIHNGSLRILAEQAGAKDYLDLDYQEPLAPAT